MWTVVVRFPLEEINNFIMFSFPCFGKKMKRDVKFLHLNRNNEKWDNVEWLRTRFPLSTPLYAGYSVKLQKNTLQAYKQAKPRSDH